MTFTPFEIEFLKQADVGRLATIQPDGTPQKLLDVSKLAEAGWTARIGLEEGLERTVAWYRDHVGTLRQ